MVRQEGYYWVRDINGWTIARWIDIGKFAYWDVLGTADGATDVCFDEIDEHRIQAPNEANK